MSECRTKVGSRGSALFTVLMTIFVLSVILTVVMGSGTQRSFTSRVLSDGVRAKAIAEAGAAYAFNALSADFEQYTNAAAFPETSFGGGTYDVDIVTVDSGKILIKSTGVYNGTIEETILDVKHVEVESETPLPSGAFAYAIVAGGDMGWFGTGLTACGDGGVHANGAYKMTGSCSMEANLSSCVQIWSTGTTVIDGDATAPDFKGQSPGNVTGTGTEASVDVVEIPDIDLTPYYNWALAHGEVYNGNQNLSGSTPVEPNGGIMWVNGDLRYSGSGDLVGCFIATGDIDISGSGIQVKVGEFPAIVSRDGDIDISGSGAFHGLLYAKNGEFDKTGDGDVVGTIICAGDFRKAGSWEVMTYENSLPLPPGSESETDHLLAVSAWQK
jgi:hypothetical protein